MGGRTWQSEGGQSTDAVVYDNKPSFVCIRSAAVNYK